VVDGKPVVSAPSRISVAVTKRGDLWLMSQFHNSPRPKPRWTLPPVQGAQRDVSWTKNLWINDRCW